MPLREPPPAGWENDVRLVAEDCARWLDYFVRHLHHPGRVDAELWDILRVQASGQRDRLRNALGESTPQS